MSKKLSQHRLSEAIDMSRNCIQQMECHEYLPPMATLFKLTRALEFDEEEYKDFMVRLRDAYEADELLQRELKGSSV